MRRSSLLLLFCVVAIPACQSGSQRVSAPPIPANWSCVTLSPMQGPIDTSLPPFACVADVIIAAGDQGRVGMTWRRAVDWDTLQWDATIERFRVKGSDLTLEQSRYPFPKSGISDLDEKKRPPADYEAFPQHEFVAMAVLGPQGVEGRSFFTGYPPNCSWADPMQDVCCADGRWHAVFNLNGPKGAPESGYNIALVEFDASGWSKPIVVVPKTGAHPIWSFSDGSEIDLFWRETYHPPLSFPDSGMEHDQVQHARIQPNGEIGVQTVYTAPKMRLFGFGSDDWVIRPVRIDANRYDLLTERHFTGLFYLVGVPPPKSELFHIADVRSAWAVTGGPLARYYSFGDCVALVLPDGRVQLAWDEEPERDSRSGQPTSPGYRITEVHYDGRSWSSPREAARTSRVGRYGLEGALIRTDELSALLLAWQDESGHLACIVGSGSGQWSEPIKTSVVVGERIWLAGEADTVTLVTQIDRNLHWCRLSFRPVRSTTRPETRVTISSP